MEMGQLTFGKRPRERQKEKQENVGIEFLLWENHTRSIVSPCGMSVLVHAACYLTQIEFSGSKAMHSKEGGDR